MKVKCTVNSLLFTVDSLKHRDIKSKIKYQKSKMGNTKHEIRNPKQIHTSSRKMGMFVLCLMLNV